MSFSRKCWYSTEQTWAFMIHSLSKTVIIVSFFKKFLKVVNFVLPQLLLIKPECFMPKKETFKHSFLYLFLNHHYRIESALNFPTIFWKKLTEHQFASISPWTKKVYISTSILFIFLLKYLWAEKPTDPAMRMMSAKFCCCPSLVRSAWKTLSKMTASGSLGRGGQNGS